MNRKSINYSADDNYEVPRLWQDKYLKKNDTQRDLISFPTGSTVATQRDDGGPWTMECQ